ncbi:hypothetical protein Ssi03_69920 [Sphaerisporangium siamense]|uniref:Phosphodiesterase n=1 Tax=Sphaerisporangium siamense TaxID=795645 RepID=A0A7W7DBJ6_9ACTN|nr:hypothetical protein [Sphaerisporangium siamense]MBB4702363.1 hypothetical protein [Sphaerisporangium siamense]GII89002.1 hypothetical protein Ssi03_69920 [Sphaerisporangium siamense]
MGEGQVISAVGGGLAAVGKAAARLRRGRPLHPNGLVLRATLRLQGCSRPLGAAFLDEPATLTGLARLSRAAGFPSPLPDILGLAVRWPVDASQTAGRADGDVCDLLLATTGHTVLGRRLLRPARRWAPGLYGSVLPYAAGPRRVLLGAIARSSWSAPANLDALARRVEEGPLPFDLIVAPLLGPWQRFGLLDLTGPALPDSAEPIRFDPVRHPIPGLEPAGVFQRLREPVYEAAQQVPDRGEAPSSHTTARGRR